MRIHGRHRGGGQGDGPSPARRPRGRVAGGRRELPRQEIDEVDAQRPQGGLDQPDRQGPLAEDRLAGREQQRIARGPDREMRDVAPLDVFVRPPRPDGPRELPVDVGVGEEVQPGRLPAPRRTTRRRRPPPPAGPGRLRAPARARPAGPGNATSSRPRPARTRHPEGSIRPCIAPGLGTRAPRDRPLEGCEKGGPAAHTYVEIPRGRWPLPSCARMVCQTRTSVNRNRRSARPGSRSSVHTAHRDIPRVVPCKSPRARSPGRSPRRENRAERLILAATAPIPRPPRTWPPESGCRGLR